MTDTYINLTKLAIGISGVGSGEISDYRSKKIKNKNLLRQQMSLEDKRQKHQAAESSRTRAHQREMSEAQSTSRRADIAFAEKAKRAPRTWGQTARSVGKKGLIGIAAGGALLGGGALVDWARSKAGEKKQFNAMMSQNKSRLKGLPREALRKRFKSLKKINPDIASDPLAAGSFVRSAMEFRETGIPIQTMGALARARKDISGVPGTAEKLIRAAGAGAITGGLK